MTLFEVAAKNALRNKFRTLMTVLGGAVAVLAFVLLRTVLYAWNIGVDFAAKDRIATRHKVSIVIPLPKHYIDDIQKKVPGVAAATYMNWFGAKWPKDPNVFFANMASADNLFDIYPEISLPKDQKDAWLADKQGAIVGVQLAKKLGLKIGDKVVLQGTIYPGDWQFNVDAIYSAPPQSSVDQSTFYFHWKYLNDGVVDRQKDKIGWVVSRIDDPSKSAQVSAAIDKLFDEEDNQTSTMSERAMNQSFLGGASAILSVLNVVSIMILVIMMLILGNTIAMGVRERTTEYGVLRALGFQPGHVRLFIVGEALTVAFFAAVGGLVLSYPIVQLGMGRWIEENMGSFFPVFRLDPLSMFLAFAATLVLGVTASLIPARRAANLQVTEALRRIA